MSWDFVPQVNDYGTFGINASTGVWSYTLANNALVDALASGETHDFLVTVTDEFGAFSTSNCHRDRHRHQRYSVDHFHHCRCDWRSLRSGRHGWR
ncbi:hypothetical protein CXF83_21450 [Shewanella sp. Choline-02u-19]|nr:hypothetical protein CXF83_21450 [Shewanella sp. Choline-02u-19]